ncbi:MAG: hypothetical protein FJY75_10050, partial [Candidatus Eisenbacteria bacterium]|nr:hypothetical protein [Candidatus Eisenbacteria bacterium]
LAALARAGDARLARAARAAGRLLGLPRQLGTHPGGIVLGDGPLGRLVPLERAPRGLLVTQFDMRGIERIGLVKIDLLGNRALALVREARRRIEESAGAAGAAVRELAGAAAAARAGSPAGAAAAARAGSPAGAAAEGRARESPAPGGGCSRTAALLASGRTLGCFQLESPAMRALLRQLRPHDLEGVIAAIALIRPGPASSGMKLAYIRRAHGEEPIAALHPRVEEVLASTLGVPLYEEDIIRMAAAAAGMSLAEADMLRRAVIEAARRARGAPSGGGAARALAALAAGFQEAARRNGIDAAAAERLWGEIVRFSAYAFCKAHAAGYGAIAYRTAWLKARHPGPFFAALLNHQRGMYPTRVYVDEARRHGLALRPPCLRAGEAGWTWEPEGGGGRGALRCGLGAVRGLRASTIAAWREARAGRPFGDLADFARRVPASAPELEALVLCGAGDEAFGVPRGELLWQLQRLTGRPGAGRRGAPRSAKEEGTGPPGRAARQASLALEAPPARARPGRHAWRSVAPAHRARLERRLLGFSLALHPVALLAPERRAGLPSIAAALARAGAEARGRCWTLVGIVSAARRIRDRAGRPLVFATLEDESGLLECVFAEPLPEGAEAVAVDAFLEVRGRIEAPRGAPSLRVERGRLLGAH